MVKTAKACTLDTLREQPASITSVTIFVPIGTHGTCLKDRLFDVSYPHGMTSRWRVAVERGSSSQEGLKVT